MDESTLLKIISELRGQITEIKGNMRENYRQEIAKMAADHENEKNLIEQKCDEKISGLQNDNSQKDIEIQRLTQENEQKNLQIGQFETSLINKDNEIQSKIQELKTKINDYNFLKARFEEKVNEIGNLNNSITGKDLEITNLKNDLKEQNQRNTTLQNNINEKSRENNRLENLISDKRQEINRLQYSVDDKRREVERLNRSLREKNNENESLESRLEIYLSKERMKKSRNVFVKKSNMNSINDTETKQSHIFKSEDEYVIFLVKNSFNDYDNIRERINYIQETMQSMYVGKWSVWMFLDDDSSYSFYRKSHSIHLKIGGYLVVIYNNN